MPLSEVEMRFRPAYLIHSSSKFPGRCCQPQWDPETRINPGSSSMLGCAEQSACMLQADCPLPPFCSPFPFLSVPFPRLVVGFGVPSRQGQNPEAQEPRLSQSRMRDWVSCQRVGGGKKKERATNRVRSCYYDATRVR